MKHQDLLKVLVTAAGITVAGSAHSAVNVNDQPADEAAFEHAMAKVSAHDLEQFLALYPDSPFAKQALGEMIRLAHHKAGHSVGDAMGFISSQNPNAAGSPDNPGVGNPHTPDC